jgi:cytochrome c oxidase cbb3-type subunit 3
MAGVNAMSDPNTPSPYDPSLGPDTGHDYDGIRELDNKLPNWWLWTLIVTVIFGYGYYTYFHVLGGKPRGALADYQQEMAEAQAAADAAARARGELGDEALLALARDPAVLTEGKGVWTQYCVACHKEKGEGLIGPNLTDGYWIHDRGAPAGLRKVIAAGVAAKGMPAWEPVLGPSKVDRVLAYVLTLKNTNVAGKPPEGEAAEGGAAAPAPAVTHAASTKG